MADISAPYRNGQKNNAPFGAEANMYRTGSTRKQSRIVSGDSPQKNTPPGIPKGYRTGPPTHWRWTTDQKTVSHCQRDSPQKNTPPGIPKGYRTGPPTHWRWTTDQETVPHCQRGLPAKRSDPWLPDLVIDPFDAGKGHFAILLISNIFG